MFGCMIVLALLASSRTMGAAKPTAIVTILQGSATVVRALTTFGAAEGMRLVSDDLVRTDKNSFLRIEYDDGTWLELGPETQLELGHPADRRAKTPALYLLTGWLKLDCPASDNGPKRALASTGMDLNDMSGTLIIRTLESSHMIFAEQGSARWVERAPHATDSVALARGDFLATEKLKTPQPQNRPAPAFVEALPLPFRDTLPNRYALFASRNTALKDPHAFGYADVEPWLDAEPAIRRQFIAWWRRKASTDEAFRAALDRNMAQHPEWDPVLHPEKYEKDKDDNDQDGSAPRTTH